MNTSSQLLSHIAAGDTRSLARAITVVENELEGYREILYALKPGRNIPVIGFTGPPGAGKSTLINALIHLYSKAGKKIGIIAIDPTSPFNYGSLLGDRLRMSEHFNNQDIFIRSLATRGSLGGLSQKTIEITDVMKSFPFDVILIETVGVGQSEVEIAGLADTTVVVLVPESGDEIQAMKSGIMEIADIFAVNKSDRPGADVLANNLEKTIRSGSRKEWITPVIKVSATTGTGIEELAEALERHRQSGLTNERKMQLLTEKIYTLIQKRRMNDINKADLLQSIKKAFIASEFNIYKFADSYSAV
ncbi:MAG: methylmalonyl Co-A mutase-associated GTPase MeaB [Bacteroidetes bacterium]|nr:methylmalonyl Co-A mutase-associated GTPase MeaB [Bacteroidota bacterium]